MEEFDLGDVVGKRNERGDLVMLSDNTELGYYFIEFETEREVMLAYDVFSKLENIHAWIPHTMPPFQIEGNEQYYIAIKGGNGSRLDRTRLSRDLLIEKTKIAKGSKGGKRGKNNDKHDMFVTRKFKIMLWSIFRAVVSFMGEDIRPLLIKDRMMLLGDGTVVFTSYAERDHGCHNSAYEIKKLEDFFDSIILQKVAQDSLVKMEYLEFRAWLNTQNLLDMKNNNTMTNIFKNVLFWTPNLRIIYICQLHDYMDGGGVVPLSDALQDRVNAALNWVDVINNSEFKIVEEFLASSKDWYKKRNSFGFTPSAFRSPVLSGSADDRLKQGLTHIKDFYVHFYKLINRKQFLRLHGCETREQFQYLIQYLFPKHMIEFAKLQDNFGFDAPGPILEILSTSEAQSARLQADFPSMSWMFEDLTL